MKNVSKKLFSLVLAAVLLLSVVPFQALAAEVANVTVRVRINQDNSMIYTQPLDTEWTVGQYIAQAAGKFGFENAVLAGDNPISYYNAKEGSWTSATQNNVLGEDVANQGVIDIDVSLEEYQEQKPEETKPEEPPVTESEMCKVRIEIVDWKGNFYADFTLDVKKGDTLDLNTHVDNYSGFAKDLDTGDKLADRFVVTRDMNIKAGNNVNKPEDEKPVDPKEKTKVIIKVYEHKGNKKVDTIYYTGERGNYVDLDQIVNKYVIRQFRYEGKSTDSYIKLQGEEMTIVAIMDEDQGDMRTVTLRVHFKNAIQKEVYKFKSGTEIDIGKILVEDDVLDSVKEIEKIYLRGVHVNKNNNIVTVKRSGTYDVYTDEKPYDSEDHGYPSYDKDEDLDKNAGKATLKFYLKKDMQKYTKPSAVKTITISNTAALDSKVTLQEVKKLAANYFKAENSEGIDFGDGLYIQEEYENAKDVWDSTDGEGVFYNVNAMRNDGDVTFFVVLDNVKSVSSGSNADSSNPKTGDSIFVAVTVMAVSSLALGAAYVLNKKRMAR